MNNTYIEKYWTKFIKGRIKDFDAFSRNVNENRRNGIYMLKNGANIMDAINNISGSMHQYVDGEEIVPVVFPTTKALLRSISSFKLSLERYNKYLEASKSEGINSYEISYLEKLLKEIEECADYCIYKYDFDQRPILYDKLRKALFDGNIDDFIGNLKSVLASVSYLISKEKEGYHHSNVHLILKMLGFDVISELSTNKGRIDVSLELIDKVYIMEFKFKEELDSSEEALEQILEKKYWQRYVIDSKKIICVGVGFCGKERGIIGHKTKELNKEDIIG